MHHRDFMKYGRINIRYCQYQVLSMSTEYCSMSNHGNSLTPWSRVCLEKLTGRQFKIFPIYYGTRSFITAFTSARHLSLSWARWIQIMPSPQFSIILPSMPGSSKWFLPSGHRTGPICNYPVACSCYAFCPYFDSIIQIIDVQYRS
jgi:hypothetical protein